MGAKKTKLLFIMAGLASLLVLQIPATAFAAVTNQSIAIPAYKYPETWKPSDPYWDSIINAGSTKVPLLVMNPNSGPGNAVSNDYVVTMQKAKAAGIRMVGYVRTGYGTKSEKDVFAEIDSWYSMYGDYISGIFFDEVKDSPDTLCYMSVINNYVKRKHNNGLTIANPGIHISDEIAPYADIFMTVEISGNTYINNYPQPHSKFEEDPANQNRIFHVLYNVSSSDRAEVLRLARERNAGFVFITDDGNEANTENQFDQLPTYFTDLTNDVTTLPATNFPNRGATPSPAGCVDPTAAQTPVNPPTDQGATPTSPAPEANVTAPQERGGESVKSPESSTGRSGASAASGDKLAETGISSWSGIAFGSLLPLIGGYFLRRHRR